MFSLREDVFKKLTNKGIINNDFDQSSIAKRKYEKPKLEPELKLKSKKSVAKRNISRKQTVNEIANKEKTIYDNLFKVHFEYSSPSNMYKDLSTTIDIEENKTKVT